MKKDDEADFDWFSKEDGSGADSHDDDEDRNMLPPTKWQKTFMKEHLEPNSNGEPAKEFNASK